MVYGLSVALDRDSGGSVRRLKDGSYRFQVEIECEGVTVMVVKGFRMPPSGVKIIPPATSSLKGMYQIVELDPEFEARMKKIVMDQVSNHVVSTGEQYRN